MDYKIGERIEFSGASGSTRSGIISKIWKDPEGIAWAHVDADPMYMWETREDLSFVVCLVGDHVNHHKCIIHEKLQPGEVDPRD